MKVVLKTSREDLRKGQEEIARRINAITLNEINNVGLQIITEARLKEGHAVGGFNDQTGNLRASIGYIVLYDGNVITTDFQSAIEGTQIGLDYANEVALSYPKGFVLIIVAGMKYATYVEDLGYDVISGSTMMAGKLMKQVSINVKNAFE